MKILTEPEEFIGKTIKNFVKMSHDKIGISFHDDSFCILESWADRDGFGNLDINEQDQIDNHDLLDLGIISEEEYEEKETKVSEENERLYIESRYNEYLKLKKEFEKE